MAEILLPSAGQIERMITLLGGNDDVFGVQWNKETDEVTRVGTTKGMVQTDFNNVYPWAGFRRCILNDNGVVVAYYGDPNYVEDGSIGQVMVEIPKFYYNAFRTPSGYQWEVTPNKKAGFKLHPAFTNGVDEFNYVYFSAYEGSIYSESEGEYLLEDEQVADFDIDKLSSIANAKPCSGVSQTLNIVNSRKLANNRGWIQQDFTTTSAIQLLYLIEYADFNTQANIGLGVVNKASGEGNESEKTGQTSHLGNLSGMSEGENGQVSISYRGIENFWGNIYKWIDGLNIRGDHLPYYSLGEYVSNKYDGNFDFAGGKLSGANGYVSDILFNQDFDFGFLPTEVKGSSNSYLADHYYQSTGNRVAHFGGNWVSGGAAGGFLWKLATSSGGSNRGVGARLLFKK